MSAAKDAPQDRGGDEDGRPPVLPFYRMALNPEGLSTIGPDALSGFSRRSVGGEADPMWMRSFPGHVKAVWFSILPIGWVGEWHPSPALQWVVTLSGRWFIETQDGQRVEMGPGEVHWGEDLEGRVVDGHAGHRSGQIGPAPCLQMMIQFDAAPDAFEA